MPTDTFVIVSHAHHC